MLLLKNILFTLIVPGTVAVYVPLFLARDSSAGSDVRLGAAILLLATGFLAYVWCLWDFLVHGKGTPMPLDAPKKLVITGLYRWVRNPMYLGVLAVIFGWALLFGSMVLAVYAFFVWLCFHLFVVLHEEQRLRQVFGSEYSEYCRKVNRWIPRPHMKSVSLRQTFLM